MDGRALRSAADMIPHEAFVERLTGPLVDLEARSGGFFRAHHYAHLIRAELLPRVGPADVPDLVAPVVVELDPDPAPTPPGTRRAVPGRTAVGLAVTLTDRVVLVWSHGVVRLRTGGVTIPYAAIAAVPEVPFRVSGQDVAGLEILAGGRVPVLFTPRHDTRYWREMLRLRLTGSLVPRYEGLPPGTPPPIVPGRAPAVPPVPPVSLAKPGPPGPPPPAPRRSRVGLLVTAVVLVAVLGATAAVLLVRPGPAGPAPAPAPAAAADAGCGITSVVVGTGPAAADADQLSLEADLRLRSTCPFPLRVTDEAEVVLRDPGGEVARGRGPAAGLVVTPDADAEIAVRFRIGSYRAVPVTAVSAEVLADVEPAPAGAVPTTGPLPVDPDVPVDGEGAARAVLDAQARTDAADVERFAETWVVQLASGRPGTVRDGFVYTYSDLLRQHLELRADDPGVRLLWSGDWSTFAAGDFHVTVLPLGDAAAASANARCDALGHGPDDCFAKYLSHVLGPENATVHR